VKTSVRDWRKYTLTRLKNLVLKLSNGKKEKMLDTLPQALEKLAPFRVIRYRQGAGQIVNTRIEKLKKKRNRLFIEFKKYGDHFALALSKHVSKKIKKLVKTEVNRTTQLKATSPNIKTFWSMVAKLLGKTSDREIRLQNGNSIITDEQELSELFANFFVDKVLRLANLEQNPIRIQNPNENCDPIVFSLDDLTKSLKKIKSKKCYGIDNIPLNMAKDFARIFPNETLSLFNKIAKIGMPSEWKMARVLPLHKKGCRLNLENYRPMYNLVSFSKIYEKMVLSKLDAEMHNLEGEWQHGFRENHSTVTAALELQTDNHLRWEAQVRSIVSKCRSKLSALKRIRNKFSMDQFLKILTSQYFSQHHHPFLTGWLTFLKPACCSYQDSAAPPASPCSVSLMISSNFIIIFLCI